MEATNEIAPDPFTLRGGAVKRLPRRLRRRLRFGAFAITDCRIFCHNATEFSGGRDDRKSQRQREQ
jgi:hypothetical protein